MEENVKKKNISFFNRLKMAIFKLEDYGNFLGERLTVAFKYFFVLVLLFSCVITVFGTYDFSKIVNKFYNYVEKEMPDFVYQNGVAESQNIVEAYDEDYHFRFFVNTTEEINEETIKEYKNKIYDNGFGIIILRESIICISDSSEIQKKYIDLENEYNFNINNKKDLVDKINTLGRGTLLVLYFIVELIILYITNVITILGDVCLVAIFGWIAGRICGLKFKMNPMIALAIYSLSLSIVLSGIYNCVYILTGFYIEYFNFIYLLIAYVYIIAAIFMIKYDLIKQTEEIQKIVEVQKQVKEELNSKEEKNDEDNEKNNVDIDNKKDEKNPKENEKDENNEIENKEPDGSEI